MANDPKHKIQQDDQDNTDMGDQKDQKDQKGQKGGQSIQQTDDLDNPMKDDQTPKKGDMTEGTDENRSGGAM